MSKKSLEMEYSAIRDEIISLTSSKDQLVSTMYILCVTIIGLSSIFNIDQIINLIFIVVIPFQAFINTKLFQIARCGAYIKVFIEPNIKGLRWEKIIHESDSIFNKTYRFNLGKLQFTRNIGKYGSTIFSVLVFFVYFCNNISISNNGIVFVGHGVFQVLMYMFLVLFVFYLNRKGTNFEKIYSTYVDIFKKYE